ncbi:MAG: hypothetical protein L0K41_01220 [Yaniella sp.]|nr:hypothetical protein [Yaniella sp.]
MMNDNWSEEARERGSREEQPTETMGQAPPPPPPASASPYWSDQQPSEPLQHKTRRFGWPVLITGVVLAGVLGGGAGGIAVHYAGSPGATSSESVQESPQQNLSEHVTPTHEHPQPAKP